MKTLILESQGSNIKPDGVELESGQVNVSKVNVVRIDEIIQEDVYLLKVDAQGYDHFVLEGASGVFQDYTVREVIFEVEPREMLQNNLTLTQTMQMMQNKYGMACFADRTEVVHRKICDYRGDTVQDFETRFFDQMEPVQWGAWALCWEDFVCINIEKVYQGKIPGPFYK